MRVGIVVSRFNGSVTERLLEGALSALKEHGVARDDISVLGVPGALEIPVVAKKMAGSGGFDAIVALGCVIRGETTHNEIVAQGAASGVARVALDTGVPVTLGVLTTENEAQAMARAGGQRGNAGRSAALAAIEVVGLLRQIEARG